MVSEERKGDMNTLTPNAPAHAGAVATSVEPVVRPTPDYKLSFGISFTEELIAAGYCEEGVCKMDNGIEGIVFCRRPNSVLCASDNAS
jgi:hypothetical protein